MKADILPSVANNIQDSKMDNEKGDRMLIGTPARRNRPLAIGFAVVAFLYFAWSMFPRFSFQNCMNHGAQLDSWQNMQSDKPLVPLEAHIMSKCPDAQVGYRFPLGREILTCYRIVSR